MLWIFLYIIIIKFLKKLLNKEYKSKEFQNEDLFLEEWLNIFNVKKHI